MSIPESPKPSKSKLPVWRTAGMAYTIIFRNFGMFLSLAAIPWVLNLSLGLPATFAQPIAPENYFSQSEFSWWWYLPGIVSQAVWAVFAVSWHRFVLRGRKDSTAPVQFLLRRREIRFFLYSLLFMAPFYIMAVLMNFIPIDGSGEGVAGWSLGLLLFLPVLGIVTAIVVIRLALLFPAIAVDSDRGLGTAWRQLGGSTWRLIWVFVIVLAPTMLVGWVFAFILIADVIQGGTMSWNTVVLSSAINNSLGFVVAAATVSALSLAYRHLTGWAPPAFDGPRTVER